MRASQRRLPRGRPGARRGAAGAGAAARARPPPRRLQPGDGPLPPGAGRAARRPRRGGGLLPLLHRAGRPAPGRGAAGPGELPADARLVGPARRPGPARGHRPLHAVPPRAGLLRRRSARAAEWDEQRARLLLLQAPPPPGRPPTSRPATERIPTRPTPPQPNGRQPTAPAMSEPDPTAKASRRERQDPTHRGAAAPHRAGQGDADAAPRPGRRAATRGAATPPPTSKAARREHRRGLAPPSPGPGAPGAPGGATGEQSPGTTSRKVSDGRVKISVADAAGWFGAATAPALLRPPRAATPTTTLRSSAGPRMLPFSGASARFVAGPDGESRAPFALTATATPTELAPRSALVYTVTLRARGPVSAARVGSTCARSRLRPAVRHRGYPRRESRHPSPTSWRWRYRLTPRWAEVDEIPGFPFVFYNPDLQPPEKAFQVLYSDPDRDPPDPGADQHRPRRGR